MGWTGKCVGVPIGVDKYVGRGVYGVDKDVDRGAYWGRQVCG